MIKANELRIGNYYRWLHEESESIHKVDVDFLKIQHAYDIDPNADEFARGWWSDGILLNEDWLFKLGFKKDDFLFSYNPDCVIGLDLTWIGVHNGRMEDDVSYDCPKYIHQLQNLYFCLTGQELQLTT